MAIEGKIARIVDDKTVVINKGAADGVKVGMIFSVVVPVDAVVDPDTGTKLGDWEAVKGRVRANHVQEHMSVCAPAPESSGPSQVDPSTHTLSAEMIEVSMMQSVVKPLPIDKSQAAGMPRLSPIRVGDKVRSSE